MKNKATKLSLYLLILAGILFQNCGGDDGESEADRVKALLTSGTWKIETVTVGGVNETDLFTDFSITFTTSGFTASNGEPVWPSDGTWIFADASAKSITRDDDIVVTLDAISETTLSLSLTWTKTTLGSGRGQSVEGDHVFVLTKN